jgi:hypothetical protein
VHDTQQHWELTRWQIDLPIAAGGDAPAVAAASGVTPSVRLEFAASDNAGPGGAPATQAVALTTDAATLKLLLHELKQARQAMQAASET